MEMVERKRPPSTDRMQANFINTRGSLHDLDTLTLRQRQAELRKAGLTEAGLETAAVGSIIHNRELAHRGNQPFPPI